MSKKKPELWGPVSSPTPVIALLMSERPDFTGQLDDATAAQDDLYWWSVVYGPFSWRNFYRWWVARRWVMPRDVRKQ